MAKNLFKYSLVVLGIALGICASAHGVVFFQHNPSHHPEIDPGLAVSALTLLAGSLAVLHIRRNK